MRNLILSALLLASAFQSTFAQGLLQQTFGSGANAFTMDFVTIGNPGNAADTTGSPNPAGSVAYIYNLGKYEVSRGQIEKANAAGSLGITMYDMSVGRFPHEWSGYGGNGVNRPATGITWKEAAKFVNWLNTSKGFVPAYKFDANGNFQLWSVGDAGYNANNMFRNSLAKFVIASSDEWYKGAYGSPSGTWYNFATGSDSTPTAVAGGTEANTAVYNGQSGPADITSAGGLSAYGTMGQAGNVWEFYELDSEKKPAYDGTNHTAGDMRYFRGGVWNDDSGFLAASNRQDLWPDDEYYSLGFRVASVPEPSSLSLLALGGVVVASFTRRSRILRARVDSNHRPAD